MGLYFLTLNEKEPKCQFPSQRSLTLFLKKCSLFLCRVGTSQKPKHGGCWKVSSTQQSCMECYSVQVPAWCLEGSKKANALVLCLRQTIRSSVWTCWNVFEHAGKTFPTLPSLPCHFSNSCCEPLCICSFVSLFIHSFIHSLMLAHGLLKFI